MRAFRTSAVTCLFALAAHAQGPYDAQGNPAFGAWATGSQPGDVWNTLVPGVSNMRGLAPYQGGLLVGVNGSTTLQHVDQATGAQLGTFPVEEIYDIFLGYDEDRDRILTANANSDVLKGYTPGIATPVFSIPSPTAGPVGFAWDPGRDEYVYCDWITDEIVVIHPTTLAVLRQFTLAPTLTRLAGVAYDCSNDTYVVSGRDQLLHGVVDPVTGVIQSLYPSAATLPQGAALSEQGGVWTSDFFGISIYEQDPGHGPTSGCAFGTRYCVSTLNSTGSAALIDASGSLSAAVADLTLTAGPVPAGEPGIFFYGATEVQIAFGDGFRCVGTSGPGSLYRLFPFALASAANVMTYSVDFANPPGGAAAGGTLAAASTWKFQGWFRDPAAGMSGFNLTDALSITFTP